jgi:guanosine-3',5'-bis(diphosphate) 3'-pyrophosphohydrolase
MATTYSFFLSRAIDYATEKHGDQKRKNITHPIEVMNYLFYHGIEDDVVLAAAVLHDVIEDTSVTYEDVLVHFGKDVADIVREVSDDKSLPKLVRKKKQVEDIEGKSFGARVIKIGDKWSNTRELLKDPPKGWTLIQVNGYILWSELVCRNATIPGDVPLKLRNAVRQHFVDLGAYEMDVTVLDAYYGSMRE